MRNNRLTLSLVLSSSLWLAGCHASRAETGQMPDRNVGMVIREIKHSSQGPRREAMVKYLDTHYANDEKVIQFYLDVIRRRDWLLLGSLSQANHVNDSRLIEPLLEWIREDRGRSHASHFILVMLHQQRATMPDRERITAELGKIMLAQSRWFGPGAADPAEKQWGYWQLELDDLALTGDLHLVSVIAPWLDRRDVIVDAPIVAVMNNGVSTRACDATYNALQVLLDLFGEPFSPFSPLKVSGISDEYKRRDVLIKQLKQRIADRESATRSIAR